MTGDGLRLPIRDGVPAGCRMTMLLRPEQLDSAPASHDPAFGVLEATLEQSVFYGATRQLVCRLANGAAITVTPSPGADGDRLYRAEPGDALRLAYRRTEPHLIEEARDGG